MIDRKVLLAISFLVLIAIISYETFSSSTKFVSAQMPTNENSTTQGSLSLPDLFTKVQKSVVQVTERDNSNEFGSRLGSGFVYDKDGHVITNYHVVTPDTNNNNELQVTFLDGSVYSADLVGFDQFDDLAVIKVKNISSDKLAPLPLANSSSLRIGESVVAIGNPFGQLGSMTQGIVSGLGRLLPSNENQDNLAGPGSSFSIPNIIQTDAAINPGNSGGPLIDTQGRVVGINTAIISNTGVYSGVGFAIPSNSISKVVTSLIQTGSYHHPYIGILGVSLIPDLSKQIGLNQTKGFLITSITKGGPADKSGLRGSTTTTFNGRDVDVGGDIILKIDNREVSKIDDILAYLESQKHVGDKVHFTILRDNAIKELDLILGDRPSQDKIDSSLNHFSDRLPPQDGDKNNPEDRYDECLSIAGKILCGLLFGK